MFRFKLEKHIIFICEILRHNPQVCWQNTMTLNGNNFDCIYK